MSITSYGSVIWNADALFHSNDAVNIALDQSVMPGMKCSASSLPRSRAMTPLRQRMRSDIQIRNFSVTTQNISQ